MRPAPLLAVGVISALATLPSHAKPFLRVAEEQASAPSPGVCVIPWVSSEKPLPPAGSWAVLPLAGADGRERAAARALLTDRDFRLDLTVDDPEHCSSKGGADLWT